MDRHELIAVVVDRTDWERWKREIGAYLEKTQPHRKIEILDEQEIARSLVDTEPTFIELQRFSDHAILRGPATDVLLEGKENLTKKVVEKLISPPPEKIGLLSRDDEFLLEVVQALRKPSFFRFKVFIAIPYFAPPKTQGNRAFYFPPPKLVSLVDRLVNLEYLLKNSG